MQQLKNSMIERAREKHERIFPCGGREELSECFTTDCGLLLFWYNTEDRSTHLIASECN
jgi:hypothetical protein